MEEMISRVANCKDHVQPAFQGYVCVCLSVCLSVLCSYVLCVCLSVCNYVLCVHLIVCSYVLYVCLFVCCYKDGSRIYKGGGGGLTQGTNLLG